MDYENFVIVISSPTSAGKSTIIKKLLEWRKDLKLSVSATTRSPRVGETNGVEYCFINKEDFEEKIKNSEFIEYVKIHDNYYGTLKSQISQNLQNNINVILDINWEGGQRIAEEFGAKQVLKIFIFPPSYKEMEKRLRNRGLDSEESMQKRLSIAKFEMIQSKEYEFIVINDNLEQAVNEIKSIIISKQIQNIKKEALTNFINNF